MKITKDMKNVRGRTITYQVYRKQPSLLSATNPDFDFGAKKFTKQRVIEECAARGVPSPVFVRYQTLNRAGFDFKLLKVSWTKAEAGEAPVTCFSSFDNPHYHKGPFSLGQAEAILAEKTCTICGHRLGDTHPVIEGPMCADQILAGEVIAWHRKKVQHEAQKRPTEAFQSALNTMGAVL